MLGIVSLLALSACSADSSSAEKRVLKTSAVATISGDSDDIDPFSLVIEAERWGVMIDNARNGFAVSERLLPSTGETDLERIDKALRSGALELIRLRDEACRAGSSECVRIELPDWVFDPPDKVTTLDEYALRSVWLGEAANRLVASGCDAGRTATSEEMFCAVE